MEPKTNPSEFFSRTYERTFESATEEVDRKKEQWAFLAELPEIQKNDTAVLISQAHGGINPNTGEYVTPGKRSPVWDNRPPVSMQNIYYEGVGSRMINKVISEGLTRAGIKNIIVNDTWEDTPIWKKRNRICSLSRNYKYCVAVEAHSNATQSMHGKAHGFEFFTCPGFTYSDVFANMLGQEFEKEFPNMKHRRFKAGEEKEARFGILNADYKCGVPIVLSENGFMDNKKMCRKYLMKEEGRFRIAKFHIKAIVQFLQYLQNSLNN